MRERKGLSAPVPEGAEPTEPAPSARRSAVEAATPDNVQGRLGLHLGGARWPLTGTRMVVGRADGGVGAHVEIDDASLSRRHAELVVTPNGWQLRDLGSTNGTRVGSATLAPGEALPVQDGDLLRFGTVEVRVARW